ncbi:hypothetical protein BD770DRAFT_468814 [Pilaira anomala]|nr:hypothetical protein BD770DRAFT_468814 [Pilaira anomala]
MFTTDSRKRKQQDENKLSSSMPNNSASSWTDFIYSSPSSPSVLENNEATQFNFDGFFLDQQQQQQQHQIHEVSGTNSRRHSVAIGEMDYHSFDFSKSSLDLNTLDNTTNASYCWDDLHLLLNPPPPIYDNTNRPIHKRTMSLREDDPNFAATSLLSPTLSTTSSNFFSTSFLEALVAENSNSNNNNNNNNSREEMNDLDMSFIETSDILSQSLEEFNHITPSSITTEINNMADWLLEQEQVKKMHTQKRQRRSLNSLSPVSPTHTLGSSLSSLSPSPPITPMQPASLGFEPILPFIQPPQPPQQQQQQQTTVTKDWDTTTSNNACALKPLIQDYLIKRELQDRSLPVTGERTIMVLTSRVAQKSYGTEKRFLCPPPTTVLKGANWWTPNNNNVEKSEKAFFNQSTTNLSCPKLTIHISGETINQTGVIEWQTPTGTLIDNAMVAANHPSTVVTGKCVSKQLYINDADEKRKRVEVLAKIQLGNGLQLGTFPSKGIKVISKPSKKRQSIKNMELCIHHGTTISLFNRIRSQTVSTKYLGVSNGQSSNASSSSSPSSSSTKSSNTNGTCFVARTGSWDPFVIWIVDTSRSPDTTHMPRPNQHHPNNPNFPPPPAIALQTPSSIQQPVAIHYNQPVVLQCVSTGLVSPVMVIRKVDKGSFVLGGNQLDDMSGKTGGECGDETLGDPVSQLHKIAFQIVQDPTFSHHNKAARYHHPSSSPPTKASSTVPNYKIPQSCHPVTYLACLNDVVGMHKTTYTRHLIPTCQPKDWSIPTNELDVKLTLDNMTTTTKEPVEKATTAAVVAAAAVRRRMSSISSTETTKSTGNNRRGSLATATSERRGSTALSSDSSGLEGACWTEDVSDAAVWTIVGTDCASYTFWTPSETTTTTESSNFHTPFVQQATTTLSNTSNTITPFPIVTETNTKDLTLSLSGENLNRDLTIWFGDIQATMTEFKSRDSISCHVPDQKDLLNSPTLILEEEGLKKKIPLLLVRGDGVVYRTDQFFRL